MSFSKNQRYTLKPTRPMSVFEPGITVIWTYSIYVVFLFSKERSPSYCFTELLKQHLYWLKPLESISSFLYTLEALQRLWFRNGVKSKKKSARVRNLEISIMLRLFNTHCVVYGVN